MNTSSRIVLVAVVGIFVLLTVLYVRSQRIKFYAQAIVIEELRDELETQKKIAVEQRELVEICRMEAEAARIECERRAMEVKN